MTAFDAALPADPLLVDALTGLLAAGTPLPETVLRAGFAAAGDDRSGGQLRLALAQLRATPADLLDLLAGAVEPYVRIAVANHPAAAEATVRRLVAAETVPLVVRQLAESSGSVPALRELAARAASEPRAAISVAERWVHRNSTVVPAPECMWEVVAGELLSNSALPAADGRQLLLALRGHLRADLAAAQDGFLDTMYEQKSILMTGVRRWLRTHPDLAAGVAAELDHPWIDLAVAEMPSCPQPLFDKVLSGIILKGLRLGPVDTSWLPGELRSLILSQQHRMTACQLDELRQALTAWNCDRYPDVAKFVNPPATVDKDELLTLFTSGPIAEVVEAAQRQAPASHEAVKAFLRRGDVSTSDALTVGKRYWNLGVATLEAIALRPEDRAFAVELLTKSPGHLRQVRDCDTILAVLTALAAAPAQPGPGSDRWPSRVDVSVFETLGGRVLELPWLVLAQLGGKTPLIDDYLTRQLTGALATTESQRLFSALSAAHTGTLAELTAAVRVTLSPIGDRSEQRRPERAGPMPAPEPAA